MLTVWPSRSKDAFLAKPLYLYFLTFYFGNLLWYWQGLKFDKLNSELLISKNYNSLLLKRIINLECYALNTAQYVRRETIEINSIPQSIPSALLENKVCQVLSLTVTTVTPDGLEACHRMKNKEKVINKFKDRKQRNHFQLEGTKIERGATTRFTVWSTIFHKWQYVLWQPVPVLQVLAIKKCW